ncbi:Nucleoside diphosphate kinase domain-containing protein [Rozella allomycis CSF55]|uniref:Nucleoside diphosphate kinase n=1 Tax=Rozella allomycis (strain CSF55) TaxID=988480 RepID=A0A075ATY2_ROZAC|nr:Nucleoside diphosphate kinase domain-containing protein [Rozella allomycis CSF55]|eukprot:EPZ33723.1 Nucleoside diphosphate kinase domain-containing protein [Rozella allomycis CSF55]
MPEVILPRTFAMIKPDIISSGREEEVLNGFNIAAQKKIHLTIDEAKSFYKEHEGKPFYETLTSWISSCSPIIALILEKEDAVQAWRQAIGPTNSIKAKEEAPDSIRAMFGTDGSLNAVHGSDSLESAEREINFFFSTPNGSQPHILVTQDDISPATNEVQPVEQVTPGEVITNAENQQTEGAPSENLADQEELKTENTTAEDSKSEVVAPSDVPSNEQPQPESTEQQIQVETQEGKEEKESQLTENQHSSDVPASEPLVKADVTQEESQNDVEPITQQIDDQKAEGVQQQ